MPTGIWRVLRPPLQLQTTESVSRRASMSPMLVALIMLGFSGCDTDLLQGSKDGTTPLEDTSGDDQVAPLDSSEPSDVVLVEDLGPDQGIDPSDADTLEADGEAATQWDSEGVDVEPEDGAGDVGDGLEVDTATVPETDTLLDSAAGSDADAQMAEAGDLSDVGGSADAIDGATAPDTGLGDSNESDTQATTDAVVGTTGESGLGPVLVVGGKWMQSPKYRLVISVTAEVAPPIFSSSPGYMLVQGSVGTGGKP